MFDLMTLRPVALSPAPAGAPAALTFALPGIWPAEQCVLVDPVTRTALIFSLVSGETVPLVRTFALTPSGTRVLLALLRAYPSFCSHRDLFLALHPQIAAYEESERGEDHARNLLPVRRALKSLLPMLRACGLRAVALRGQGYLLAAGVPPSAHDAGAGDPHALAER